MNGVLPDDFGSTTEKLRSAPPGGSGPLGWSCWGVPRTWSGLASFPTDVWSGETIEAAATEEAGEALTVRSEGAGRVTVTPGATAISFVDDADLILQADRVVMKLSITRSPATPRRMTGQYKQMMQRQDI